MVENKKVLLIMNTPKWVIFVYCIGMIILLLFYIFHMLNMFKMIFNDISFSKFFPVTLTFCLLAGLWALKLLLYSTTATDNGLESSHPFMRSKSCAWDEIVKIRRPRFLIPNNVSYVVLKNKKKITLIRSMENYNELIELIKDRAPNLIT